METLCSNVKKCRFAAAAAAVARNGIVVGGVLMSVGHTRQGPETYAAKKRTAR